MSINDLLDSEWVLIFVVAVLIVTPIIAVPKWISMKKNEDDNIYGKNDNNCEIIKKTAKVLLRRTASHPLDKTVSVNYIVFEFENGERLELAIKDRDVFSKIIEGDKGCLVYRGKLFLNFERGA